VQRQQPTVECLGTTSGDHQASRQVTYDQQVADQSTHNAADVPEPAHAPAEPECAPAAPAPAHVAASQSAAAACVADAVTTCATTAATACGVTPARCDPPPLRVSHRPPAARDGGASDMEAAAALDVH